MDDFYLQLIQVGFHGVAAAFLYLGYKLRKPLLEPEENLDVPNNDSQMEFLKIKIASSEKFLTVSLLFLLIGAGLEIGRLFIQQVQEKHPHQIKLFLQPANMPENTIAPKINHEGISVQINPESGSALATVIHKDSIHIIVTPLTNKIRKQANQIQVMQFKINASDPDEVGLSDE